jgi:hypothetical protein
LPPADAVTTLVFEVVYQPGVMTGAVLVTVPALAWPAAVAVALSAGRSGFALRNVHHAMTG